MVDRKIREHYGLIEGEGEPQETSPGEDSDKKPGRKKKSDDDAAEEA